MSTNGTQGSASPLKLNLKRTFLIGFAFFGILLLWQVYDTWCPTFLSELFMKAFGTTNAEDVQYVVGCVMALDNLAALIMLPIFGRLSDKTHTKFGKRMPYIMVGTLVCAIAFPFIPVLFHFNNLAGVISIMAIVVFFAMMYRNPAVALMPDMTPKPLRSKANGIINIMGYIGGFFATLVGMVFVLSEYLGKSYKNGAQVHPEREGQLWVIMIPFIVASVLMLISALVLFFTVKENKIAREVADDMRRGDQESELVDKVTEDTKVLSKANRNMLLLILAAEFLWFMADNGIATFMGNYTVYFLGASTRSNAINTIVGGVGSVVGFALGGIIASKIGRKWTLLSGLFMTVAAYAFWGVMNFTVLQGAAAGGSFPIVIYIVWFIKGLGMSLVHVNSFPMVVELCNSEKIGRYTGYYYASSMAAQTLTPVLLGLLLLNEGFGFDSLPFYGLACSLGAAVIFLFIKNVQNKKTTIAKGLEAFGQEED